MIDKKEPSFVSVMEQHSRKQSVCNNIRVHCFPHWSSVSTTILHLVKDRLLSLSIEGLLIFSTISLACCILESLSTLSEDTDCQDCLLSKETCRLQVVRHGGCGKQMIMMFVCQWPGQHSSLHHFTLLWFIPLPPIVFHSSVIAPTCPDLFNLRYVTRAMSSALVCCVLSLLPGTLCALRLSYSVSPVDPFDPCFKVKWTIS